MVAHDGVGADIDGKQFGELSEPAQNPFLAVLVGLAAELIAPTEKRAPDAT
jgi:hypothetical protein